MSLDNIEELVNVLADNPDYVDKLNEEQVDYLINYLEKEIEKEEKILDELKNSN